MFSKTKEFFTLPKTIVTLFVLLGLAIVAHIKFFLNDARPFVDHDAYYLCTDSLLFFADLHDLCITFLNKFLPSLVYDGFFIYKMLNLLYLIPVMLFTYLIASSLYSRAVGLLAVFLVMTYPDVLNIFHKSEVNFMIVTCFSMCLYFYLKSVFLEKIYYSLLFFMALFLFAKQHYSFVLYFNICLPVICAVSCYRKYKASKCNVPFLLMMFFVVLCMEFSLVFVFFWTPSGLLCALFPAFACFVVYKFFEMKKIHPVAIFFIGVLFLMIEIFLLDKYWPLLNYSMNLVKEQVLGVAAREPARYASFWSFIYVYLKRICFFYRSKIFVFDFTFYNYSICLIFYFLYTGRQLFKRNNWLFSTIAESALLLMVFIGLLLMSFGLGDSVKFFSPFLVAVAILNAGFFYRCYFLYANFKFMRGVLFFFLAVLFVTGMMSLFTPNLLVKNIKSHKNFYYSVSDDYNLSEFKSFLLQEQADISLDKVMFLNEEGLIPVTSAFFSFWITENVTIEKMLSLPKKRYPEYVFALYNYNKANNPPVDVYNVDKQLKSEIMESIHLDDSNRLLLKKIFAYGKKHAPEPEIKQWDVLLSNLSSYVGGKKDLLPCREILVFVYKTDF